MARKKKTFLAAAALLAALCLGAAFAACGQAAEEKKAESVFGYGEEGVYYYASSDGSDHLLTLSAGTYVFSAGAEVDGSGSYSWESGTLVLRSGDDETGEGSLTDGGVSLRTDGRTYLFLRYEYYTVTFTDGGTTLSARSVLNGKTAADPGDAEKEGYVFLGWYADASFTERYGFDTAVTADTTVYARFDEMVVDEEFVVTYDPGNGETYTAETLNGKIYDLPGAEMTGYTFLGWWVSATNRADELTYKYTGETLYEDTTLFAVFVRDGVAYMGASVRDDGLTWENYDASVTTIYLTDEGGDEVDRFEIQSTDRGYAYDFASLPAGRYTISIRGGGVDETLVYVSHALHRVSKFEILVGSILRYSPVENAERYYVTVDCGNEGHSHVMVDNGTALYYDFSSCEMGPDGITFTVVAVANGYVASESAAYVYFLALGDAAVRVEGDTVLWDRVDLALEYEVYVDGVLAATTSDLYYSLDGYDRGTYEIAVRPVTHGYWSERSEPVMYTKTSLASPKITGIGDYTVSWTEVEDAVGYKVSINGKETTVSGGSVTSLILTGDDLEEGLDSYEISVKALAEDSADDSLYSEPVTVTGTGVGSAVSYGGGTVTWQYSLSAAEYRITVNDGDETVVTGINSAPVTLTKSGDNEITIYFVNEYDEIYGTASMTVYAYAILFDARGGTVYLDGAETDVVYVARGDPVSVPTAWYGEYAEFLGWYTVPDLNEGAGDYYTGNGARLEEGTVFTGTSNAVYYAFWSYRYFTVTLDAGDGFLEGSSDVEIKYDSPSYALPVPDTDDKAYAFIGWYSGPDGAGAAYTDGEGGSLAAFTDTGDVTLYAYWGQVLSFSAVNSAYSGARVASASKGPDIGLVTEVTVPETYVVDGTETAVGEIGSSAFSDCPSLKTLNVPDTVLFIQISGNGYDPGCGAFEGTTLESVNVYATGEPSTTKEVIYYSEEGVLFRRAPLTGDVELTYYPYGRQETTYTVPETVENENEYAYTGNGFATEHVVREVNAIGESVFYGHTELVYMVIPWYIDTIGVNAFRGCTSLVGVEFEPEIEVIGQGMFYGCTSLTEFEIPGTVTEIGESAFRECTGLTSFYVPDNVVTLGGHIFRDCTNLRYVRMSGCVTEIGTYDFYGCTSLETFVVPDSVTTIGSYAFSNCWTLSSVTLGASLSSIGSSAFRYCYSLVEIYNRSSMTLSIGSTGSGYVAQYAKYIYNEANGSHIFDDDGYRFVYDASGSYYLVGYYGLDTDLVLPDSAAGNSYAMTDYAFYGDETITGVTIPANCTSVGGYAFQNCTSLKTVTMAEGVESIGTYAFQNCTSLEGISIPDSVTSLGTYAFNKCTALTYVDTGDGVKSIENYMFDGCDLLETVTIGGSVTSIGTYAFRNCYALTTLTMGDAVTSIGNYAFYNCSGMKALGLSSSLKSVGDRAFYGCSSIMEIVIPDSVTSLGTYCFYGCSSAVTLTIGSGVATLPDRAFQACSSLKGATIPDTVTSLGTYVFYDCTSLETVSIGSGVTGIPSSAFTGCSSLGSVTIPDTVKTISQYAFQNCTSLETVSIGSGVTEIGSNAFRGCTKLASLVLPGGVTSLGTYAFAECTGLASVTLSEGLTEIGNYGFYGCSSLREIVIPDSVTTIGTNAFQNCTLLTSVTLGAGIEVVGRYAFDNTAAYNDPANWEDGVLYMGNCLVMADSTASGDIVVKDGTKAIAAYAFYQNTAVEALTLPESCTAIGDYSFRQCTALTAVSFGSGVTYVGAYAFYNCTALKSDVMLGSVVTLGGSAFYGCTGVKSVDLGDSLVTMGTYAFYGCTGIGTIVIPDTCTAIPNYAFRGCSALESVTIGSGVASIGQYAFQNCTSLTGIVIPDGVTSIDTYAFSGCSALEWVVIGSGMSNIGNNAFSNCTKLSAVYYGGASSSDWGKITIGATNNTYLTDAERYYYSETEPAESGNFWRFVDGKPVIWGKEG